MFSHLLHITFFTFFTSNVAFFLQALCSCLNSSACVSLPLSGPHLESLRQMRKRRDQAKTGAAAQPTETAAAEEEEQGVSEGRTEPHWYVTRSFGKPAFCFFVSSPGGTRGCCLPRRRRLRRRGSLRGLCGGALWAGGGGRGGARGRRQG